MLKAKFMPTIAERDIDLILVEELSVNVEFSDWLSSRIFGLPVLEAPLGAWHSVSDPSFGESDIVHIFKSSEGGGQMALLIENKINAPPQPEQAERYRKRGEKGKAEGLWDDFRTCVLAPAQYLTSAANTNGYQSHISYEEILSFFTSRRQRDPRYFYKAKVVREGIEKQREGYQPTISPEMTRFVQEYATLAAKEYPALGVFPAKPRPAGSTWVSFRPKGYPQAAIISHQLNSGKVKLFLSGAADDFDTWLSRFSPVMTPSMSFERAGKSVALSLDVPMLDPIGKNFDQQESLVRKALDAVAEIDGVYRKVK